MEWLTEQEAQTLTLRNNVQHTIAALRSNPGNWARVMKVPAQQAHRARTLRARLAAAGAEATTKTVHTLGVGYHTHLYARWPLQY